MANKELYDYLTAVTQIRITGNFNVVVLEADDDAETRIILGTAPRAWIDYPFKALSQSDAGTLFEFFYDAAYGGGIAYSFKLTHPTDGHTYVVRFDCDLEQVKQNVEVYGYGNCRFKVLGRIND
jgi:hypothetical protein